MPKKNGKHNKDGFLTITNEDIYNEIKSMREELSQHIEKNNLEHNTMNEKISGYKKIVTWLAGVGGAIMLFIASVVFALMEKK